MACIRVRGRPSPSETSERRGYRENITWALPGPIAFKNNHGYLIGVQLAGRSRTLPQSQLCEPGSRHGSRRFISKSDLVGEIETKRQSLEHCSADVAFNTDRLSNSRLPVVDNARNHAVYVNTGDETTLKPGQIQANATAWFEMRIVGIRYHICFCLVNGTQLERTSNDITGLEMSP
ncbi:hypothetical protein LZ30DRAFT_28231 [Colletotrichum cereale]|nr:hypothetical protein LZ30DRAFT_28231 [Colletotrichum cereale]